MSRDRLPPPPPECLWRLRGSTPGQRGGTCIAEDVRDPETHEQRRRDPDGYRLERCFACGGCVLHVHDHRSRTLHGERERPATVTLVRYLCVGCRATWRVVPLFVARWLWRSWPVVESRTLGPPPPPSAPRVPDRTTRRWRARLATAARRLVEVLHAKGDPVVAAIAAAVGEAATRCSLVKAIAEALAWQPGERLSRLAALVDQVAPGARLM